MERVERRGYKFRSREFHRGLHMTRLADRSLQACHYPRVHILHLRPEPVIDLADIVREGREVPGSRAQLWCMHPMVDQLEQ